MPVGQGTRRWTQRLLRGPQVRVQRRPEALQPTNLIGELLRLHRHAEEMLRLGRTGGDDVRQERPFDRQLLGFDFAKPNLQQQIAHGLETNGRSEEHTSELQSLMRISYAVFCLKKKKKHTHSICIHSSYSTQ